MHIYNLIFLLYSSYIYTPGACTNTSAQWSGCTGPLSVLLSLLPLAAEKRRQILYTAVMAQRSLERERLMVLLQKASLDTRRSGQTSLVPVVVLAVLVARPRNTKGSLGTSMADEEMRSACTHIQTSGLNFNLFVALSGSRISIPSTDRTWI